MATKNTILMTDSDGNEIPEGATVRAGEVSFSGTTKADKDVHVEVGDRKFSFNNTGEQLPVIGIQLAAGSYIARYKFDHLEEEKRRSFTLT